MDLQQWMTGAGSMMFGFFLMSAWSRWLERRSGVPRWVFLVPKLVLGLTIALQATAGLYYYDAWQKTGGDTSKEAVAKLGDHMAMTQNMLVANGVVLVVGLVAFAAATAMSAKPKDKTEARRLKRESIAGQGDGGQG